MRRKRISPKPFKEGYLKEIYELFFLPLIKLRPRYIGVREWLEMIFNVETRTIDRYETLTTFSVPGDLLAAPNIPIPGIGYRMVKAGTVVWIRHDTTNPNVYDFEAEGSGRKHQVFRLTEDHWNSIKNNLKIC